MYEIMSSDEAIRLIRDGDCICVNSFVGIENPVELHEAIYRRYQRMQSPRHLTIISSAGFGVWDEEHNAEGYIREGAVDRLICGHFGAMLSTKKLVLEYLVKLNREQGMTVIVVSSELVELRSVCDRIAIVSDGRLASILKPDDSDADFGLAMSGGLKKGGGQRAG